MAFSAGERAWALARGWQPGTEVTGMAMEEAQDLDLVVVWAPRELVDCKVLAGDLVWPEVQWMASGLEDRRRLLEVAFQAAWAVGALGEKRHIHEVRRNLALPKRVAFSAAPQGHHFQLAQAGNVSTTAPKGRSKSFPNLATRFDVNRTIDGTFARGSLVCHTHPPHGSDIVRAGRARIHQTIWARMDHLRIHMRAGHGYPGTDACALRGCGRHESLCYRDCP
mmetsp:Transcript_2966/g.8280  ORF Transcript_2966/g.8280 Transcript_2966/m.8280 type:complete len:223 (-) Transcript_2966:36-704(-)